MYHNSTNCLIIASEATLVFIQDPKPCTFLIVSLCKCPTHMYIVFFLIALPELMLVHCQLTPRMSIQCALHYTCTLCHMTDLYVLNCIYIISTT